VPTTGALGDRDVITNEIRRDGVVCLAPRRGALLELDVEVVAGAKLLPHTIFDVFNGRLVADEQVGLKASVYRPRVVGFSTRDRPPHPTVDHLARMFERDRQVIEGRRRLVHFRLGAENPDDGVRFEALLVKTKLSCEVRLNIVARRDEARHEEVTLRRALALGDYLGVVDEWRSHEPFR